MSDGAPISQEIRLPTNSDEITKATAKLDALIAQVGKLEHAGEGHRKATKETEGAFKSMIGTIGKVVRGELMMAEGFHGIGVAAGEARKSTGEFLEFVGAIAALEMLEKIADKMADIGKEAVKTAAEAQRMNFAIDAAAGGKEKGENVRKWIGANAKHSEFSEATNESAYLGLKRYGVEDQKAGLYMKAAEDLAAVAPPDKRQEVYEAALSGFERMHARGKIDARSAQRGFGFGVEDFAKLPAFQGMNKKAISKALQDGSANVNENDILNMVVGHTGEKGIGERGADASELLLTRMAKLSELPTLFYKRLGETGAAKKLATEIGHILDEFDPDSPRGKRIFGTLEKTFTQIADVVGEIDFDSLADSITDDVLPAVKKMVGLLSPTLNFIEREIRGIHALADLVFGEDPKANDAFSKIEDQKWGKPDENELSFLEKPDHPTVEGRRTGADVSVWHGKMHMVGEGAADGFAEGVHSSASKVDKAAGDLAERAHGIPKRKLKIHSPSQVMEQLGKMTGEGFSLGLRSTDLGDLFDSTMRVAMPSAFSSIAMPSARGAAPNLSIVVNVTATGGQDGAGLGQTIAQAVRREVTNLLERTAAE